MSENIPYQLSCKTNHDAFVFMDNADPNDRFFVMVTIRKLPMRENAIICREILRRHGPGALARRSRGEAVQNTLLEYMKYTVVYHQKEWLVFDMDTLHEVETSSATALKKCKTTNRNPLPIAECAAQLNQGFSCHRGAYTSRMAHLEFPTEKHGMVTLTLSVYEDPDIRNGISLKVEKNMTVDSAWGAAIKAVHPKILTRDKKWFKLPPIMSREKIKSMHETDSYWETCDGFTERRGREIPTRMKIPRHLKRSYV